MLTLTSPLSSLFGVGPKNQKLFKKLNLTTCEDLLYYFPIKYKDYSRLILIKDLKQNEQVTLKVLLKEIYSERSPHKRLFITHTTFSDASGEIEIVWFNQPFLNQTLKVGRSYWLSGQAKQAFPGLNFEVKEYEAVGRRQIHTGRLLPSYSLTKGLTNRYLRLWLSQVLSLTSLIKDFLPPDLMAKEKLLTLNQALAQIHYPNSATGLAGVKNRLAFDELFLSHLRPRPYHLI